MALGYQCTFAIEHIPMYRHTHSLILEVAVYGGHGTLDYIKSNQNSE